MINALKDWNIITRTRTFFTKRQMAKKVESSKLEGKMREDTYVHYGQ